MILKKDLRKNLKQNLKQNLNKLIYKYSSKDDVIEAAKSFINEKCYGSYNKSAPSFCDPQVVSDFLILKLMYCLFLFWI